MTSIKTPLLTTIDEVVRAHPNNAAMQKAEIIALVQRGLVPLTVEARVGAFVVTANSYPLETFLTEASARFYVRRITQNAPH